MLRIDAKVDLRFAVTLIIQHLRISLPRLSILVRPHHKDTEPTGLHLYSTVSQLPSVGILAY